jgi:hypothetical protein
MQPPVQPVGAETCSIELSALFHLLPKGLMLGGAINNGDCFFDSVCQVLSASKLQKFGRVKSVDVRLAVKEFWDAKSNEEAAGDFGALKNDTSLMLPSCITSVGDFKNWLKLPAGYIAQKARIQGGQPGFGEFATVPYWGGIMDCQVAELLVFLTMNINDCTPTEPFAAVRRHLSRDQHHRL